jgi:hypothetical protein
MTGHGMLRDESGRRKWRQLGAWVHGCTWALGRGMREGAWWTAEQGQPCCGCKASDVHQAWGTWGMRVLHAELGLAPRARGMRARSWAVHKHGQGMASGTRGAGALRALLGASAREQGVGTGEGGKRRSAVDKQSKEDSDAVDAKPAMYTWYGTRKE